MSLVVTVDIFTVFDVQNEQHDAVAGSFANEYRSVATYPKPVPTLQVASEACREPHRLVRCGDPLERFVDSAAERWIEPS